MTESELIRSLETALAAQADPEGYYTTDELCDLTGLEGKAVRRRLRTLKRAKRLHMVEVRRPNLRGVMMPVPAYRVLPT